MNRRTALSCIGSAGIAAVAGCLEGSGGDTPDRSTGSATPAVTRESFEVTNVESGTTDQSADVAFGSPLTITGTTTGNNGCYTAVLDDVSYSDGTLTVTVRAKEKDDAEMCTDALVRIDYEATFEFARNGPQEVVVKHDSMGEVRTVETATSS